MRLKLRPVGGPLVGGWAGPADIIEDHGSVGPKNRYDWWGVDDWLVPVAYVGGRMTIEFWFRRPYEWDREISWGDGGVSHALRDEGVRV